MAAVVARDCRVYWRHAVEELAAGQEVPDGEFATFLVDGGLAEPSGPAVDTDGDGVPDGTVAQVLEWVGQDAQRAEAARAAEQAKGDKARATLVASLDKLLTDN